MSDVGLTAFWIHGNKRLVDLCLVCRRELDLCFFCSFLETLKRHLVLREVDTVLFLELIRKVVNDAHIKVFTTKERVTIG